MVLPRTRAAAVTADQQAGRTGEKGKEGEMNTEKTLGEMTPTERNEAIKRAVRKLQRELDSPEFRKAVEDVLNEGACEHEYRKDRPGFLGSNVCAKCGETNDLL